MPQSDNVYKWYRKCKDASTQEKEGKRKEIEMKLAKIRNRNGNENNKNVLVYQEQGGSPGKIKKKPSLIRVFHSMFGFQYYRWVLFMFCLYE